jgi:hypothetical protein
MGLEWIHLAQDNAQVLAFVNFIMNQLVPCLAENFWSGEVDVSR